MMPVIFTVLGVCIGIKPGEALKSGLKVGVGFIGLSIVTALLHLLSDRRSILLSISMTFSFTCLIWAGPQLPLWPTIQLWVR